MVSVAKSQLLTNSISPGTKSTAQSTVTGKGH